MAEAAAALTELQRNEATLGAIVEAGQLLTACLRAKGHVYSCGNGGSLCDAMHFAEELSGKFRRERPPLAALAISDPAHLTCTGNDFGYDEVFARFVAAHGRPGDVLVAISTSGTSKNVLKAAEAARAADLRVVALTGKTGTPLAALADVTIATPSRASYSDRVQELHIKVIHTLIELVERQLFPANYG
jgi:D-sedoheptulose 7-phosphate isomerase